VVFSFCFGGFFFFFFFVGWGFFFFFYREVPFLTPLCCLRRDTTSLPLLANVVITHHRVFFLLNDLLLPIASFATRFFLSPRGILLTGVSPTQLFSLEQKRLPGRIAAPFLGFLFFLSFECKAPRSTISFSSTADYLPLADHPLVMKGFSGHSFFPVNNLPVFRCVFFPSLEQSQVDSSLHRL